MVLLWPYKHPSLMEGETSFHLSVLISATSGAVTRM